MIHALLIDIPLTGERSYLHGADIFDALLRLTGANRDIVLSLKAASACAIEVTDLRPGVPPADACGVFRHASDGGIQRFVLRRRADRPITQRTDQDEEALVEGACFTAERAIGPAGDFGATFIRRAIAIYIALIERKYPDDYWTIAEIACARAPRDDASVEVAVRSCAGERFWKATVRADGEPMGHVILARGLPQW